MTIGVVVLGIAVASAGDTRFAEITVERINVVEASGTIRMVITNRERLPNIIIDGKQAARENRSVQPAGILLYDEKGNEAGGLATTALPDGASGSMLVLDYGRSEAIGIVQRHAPDGYQAALVVNDPADPTDRDGAGPRRIALSTAARVSSIELSDTRGRPRIRLSVDANDRPSIAVLDESGAVVGQLPDP